MTRKQNIKLIFIALDKKNLFVNKGKMLLILKFPVFYDLFYFIVKK
jgi:hypothetical protein